MTLEEAVAAGVAAAPLIPASALGNLALLLPPRRSEQDGAA